jgi:hypothetical protein
MSGLNNSDESIVEQTPLRIRDFSSQYGSNIGRNYSVGNICKEQAQIYPLYGDSTDALVFRTYGPWWINMPSYRETKRNFTRQENEFTSRDFIDIEYSNLVYQCISLNIYETYNPGSLEVVYVGKENENGNITWHRVWTFPEPFSIVLTDSQEIFIENGKNLYCRVNSTHEGTSRNIEFLRKSSHNSQDYQQKHISTADFTRYEFFKYPYFLQRSAKKRS